MECTKVVRSAKLFANMNSEFLCKFLVNRGLIPMEKSRAETYSRSLMAKRRLSNLNGRTGLLKLKREIVYIFPTLILFCL